jgi:FKBP-type peptidyl-prolyl cis-trans isomerase 2
MAVKKGDKVKIDYTGTLDDGTVFDSSEKHGQPLEFEVGSGQVIKGVDEAVVGMKKGDEKEVKLKPEEAYGSPREELVKKVPRGQFPEKMELKEGMILVMGTPDGQKIPATIRKVEEKEVTLDLNHPLSGKNLTFKIKVI